VEKPGRIDLSRRLYGAALLAGVEEGSAAEEAGLRAGDIIHTVDGERLRDLIDIYLILADEGEHVLEVGERGNRKKVRMESGGKPAGLQVERPVFGEVIRCNNNCPFCFVDQLPRGLRSSLYVKDDDYRLSFLLGNFITLTNLAPEDMERITGEMLSPMYVSLHATEAEARNTLFGNSESSVALEWLDRLLESGIEVHVQLVLMRSVNDGEVLNRTMEDLTSRFSAVSSVGVVPVGISRYARLDGEVGYDSRTSEELLLQLEEWTGKTPWRGPLAADEFYFMCGEAPPPEEHYGGYPQLENGIGLARRFISEFTAASDGHRGEEEPGGKVILTAPMGEWALMAAGVHRTGARISVSRNNLFGERVNVCGLMTGDDVRRTVLSMENATDVLIPSVAIGDGRFLDGVTPEELSRGLPAEIRVVETGGRALLDEMRGAREVGPDV
jgi:putative radical SAM enzyme (TIGR03279 family)